MTHPVIVVVTRTHLMVGLVFFVMMPMIVWSLPFRLVITLSDSLPYRLFLVHQDLKPSKGDYGVIDHPAFDRVLVKKIVGVAGDQVIQKNEKVSLNDQVIGDIIPQDSKGNPLMPIQSTIIPAEYVFVAGSSAQSYDSRYEAFGLIHQTHLKGTAWPLF